MRRASALPRARLLPLAALLAVLLAVLVAAPTAHAEWLQRDAPIMGTRCTVEVWSPDRAAGEAAIDAVFEEFRRIDRLMSTYKPDSEISAVNDRAARAPVRVSQEFFDLIAQSVEYSKLTRGAFDITYASVGYLYDYRAQVHPDAARIAAALPGINWRHIELLPKQLAIRFRRPGVRIDLGGIAKGYAVDRGIAVLRARGIDRAMVNAGGDTRIIGDRFGRPWMIGIRNPDDGGKVALRLPLEDVAISTSGDYERYFEEDGVRYHHILDPQTGKSASKVRSVTIITDTATRSDALTKSVFIMGAEAGIAFINTLPDVDAIAIDPTGKVHYSRGLAPP
jgi:FAD:protein FMN transferase